MHRELDQRLKLTPCRASALADHALGMALPNCTVMHCIGPQLERSV